MSDIQIKTISSLNDFREMKAVWNRLVERMDYPLPFVSHEWLCAWWEGWARGRPAIVLTGWHNGELIGGLPLIRDWYPVARGLVRFHSWQSMTFEESPSFGIPCVPDHLGGFLAAVQRHLEEQTRDWDVLLLERLQTTPVTVEMIKSRFNVGHTCWLARAYPGSYFLELNGDFDSYFRSLSKAFIKDRKYKNNKLARLGDVSFSITGYSEKSLETFYRMEHSGWKHRTSILAQAQKKVFYDKLAENFAALGKLSLVTLSLNGEPVVSVFGLIDRETFYFLKIGLNYDVDEKIQKTTPGQALFFHLMQHCFAQKLKYFDFCGPFYDYERMWTKGIHQKYNLVILNRRKLLVRLYLRLRVLKRQPAA
jgi:CelD/BcsL family acetyltransferase involved in cellulose biosynthesis